MTKNGSYDVAIIGGGLAGLAAAIFLQREQFSVVLFEKENYPFHKVCGEYISMESWELIIDLGIPLSEFDLPRIDNLSLSSPDGSMLKQKLPLGGFGISRYRIDHGLADVARKAGVKVNEGCRVTDAVYDGKQFTLTTDKGAITSRMCCGAFGKRSNLDIRWKRPFALRKAGLLNNFIAVKYHALCEHPRNHIALHYFKDGYCGVSPIEDGKSCICYMTTANNLRKHGSDIQKMERELLFRNPFIHETFSHAEILYERPLTISQISFDKKELVRDHILFAGDAAGLITPLCGNGMSMALHGARIASELITHFLGGSLSRDELEKTYEEQWQSEFSGRLLAGRIIQGAFSQTWLTNVMVKVLRNFPGAVSTIVKQTHG